MNFLRNKNTGSIILITLAVLLLGDFLCFAGKRGNKWQSLETNYTILHYITNEDLVQFDDKVKYGKGWRPKLSAKVSSSPNSISEKIDSLYERVQEILDMRGSFKKVSIKIYPDKKSLHAAYFAIYKKKRKLRAWYIYERNTVYVTIEDLHSGMLAHEIGHAVIDHFFSARPPKATAEILARYIDKHL